MHVLTTGSITSLLILGCVTFIGCVSEPRFGTKVTSTDAAQAFDGLVPEAGGTVTVQVRTYGGMLTCNEVVGWADLTTIIADTSPAFTDGCGTKWYRFSKTVQLPNKSTNWCLSGHLIFYQSEYQLKWAGRALPVFGLDAESTCHPSAQCVLNVNSECALHDPVTRIYCMQIGDPACQVKF